MYCFKLLGFVWIRHLSFLAFRLRLIGVVVCALLKIMSYNIILRMTKIYYLTLLIIFLLLIFTNYCHNLLQTFKNVALELVGDSQVY